MNTSIDVWSRMLQVTGMEHAPYKRQHLRDRTAILSAGTVFPLQRLPGRVGMDHTGISSDKAHRMGHYLSMISESLESARAEY
jgi:hypothetical protein